MNLFYAALAAAFLILSALLLIRPAALWLLITEEAIANWLLSLGGVVSLGLIMYYIIG